MWNQDDAVALELDAQRIACTKPEPAADAAWENDLTLGGNSGTHGKTILPDLCHFINQAHRHSCLLMRSLVQPRIHSPHAAYFRAGALDLREVRLV